jgi:hypothetical protein
MAKKRYTANKDNIITNGFNYTLNTRGTGSNMGYADSLEVYSIYGQASSSNLGRSQEIARTLVAFPVNEIATDRTAGSIPVSGSVSFYMRMFNVETAFTLPQDFTLKVYPVSQSWAEGTGLDMEEYSDLGASNWLQRGGAGHLSTASWGRQNESSFEPSGRRGPGGHYYFSPSFSASFPQGYEDLDINVTPLVEEWIAGTKVNNGVIIKLTGSQEAYHSASSGTGSGGVIMNVSGSENTFYTKRFSARSSQYFFKRPIIEARWDSQIRDQRENFIFSSSVATGRNNLNTLYFYNYVRGRLADLPGIATTAPIFMSLYSGSTAPTGSQLVCAGYQQSARVNITGGHVSTGIYSASVALTAAIARTTDDRHGPPKVVFDVWHSGSIDYHTGSIYPENPPIYAGAPTFARVTTIQNLRKEYSRTETARFRLFVRDKDWSPTIYTVATSVNPTAIIESASYSIVRTADNLQAVSYGTGSNLSTILSYDVSGNYFDFDMSMLQAGYMYGIKLSYYNDSIGSWIEQPNTFKFRVKE